MKKYFLLLILFLSATLSFSQNWSNWKQYSHLQGEEIRSIATKRNSPLQNDELFVSTMDKVVSIKSHQSSAISVRNEGFKFLTYNHFSSRVIGINFRNQFVDFQGATIALSGDVKNKMESNLLGTYIPTSQGVKFFSNGTIRDYEASRNIDYAEAVLTDKTGNVIVAMYNEIFCDADRNIRKQLSVKKLAIDDKENIWVLSNLLSRYRNDTTRWVNIEIPKNICELMDESDIVEMLTDRQGNLWIATFYYVFRLDINFQWQYFYKSLPNSKSPALENTAMGTTREYKIVEKEKKKDTVYYDLIHLAARPTGSENTGSLYYFVGNVTPMKISTSIFIQGQTLENFKASKKPLCQKSIISFVHQVDPKIGTQKYLVPEEYIWNFGDSTDIDTTTNSEITHQYERSGEYKVKLKIITQYHSKDTAFTISISPKPKVNLLIDNTCSGQTTLFKDNTSIEQMTPITSYYLDFGDGTNKKGIMPSDSTIPHKYNKDQKYKISYTVMTKECADTFVDTIEIALPPTGEIKVEPEIACDNSNITFSVDTAKFHITEIKWNFDESNDSNFIDTVRHIKDLISINAVGSPSTTHTYSFSRDDSASSKRTRTIKAVIYRSKCKTVITKTINLHRGVKAEIKVAKASYVHMTKLVAVEKTNNPAKKGYKWNFGDEKWYQKEWKEGNEEVYHKFKSNNPKAKLIIYTIENGKAMCFSDTVTFTEIPQPANSFNVLMVMDMNNSILQKQRNNIKRVVARLIETIEDNEITINIDLIAAVPKQITDTGRWGHNIYGHRELYFEEDHTLEIQLDSTFSRSTNRSRDALFELIEYLKSAAAYYMPDTVSDEFNPREYIDPTKLYWGSNGGSKTGGPRRPTIVPILSWMSTIAILPFSPFIPIVRLCGNKNFFRVLPKKKWWSQKYGFGVTFFFWRDKYAVLKKYGENIYFGKIGISEFKYQKTVDFAYDEFMRGDYNRIMFFTSETKFNRPQLEGTWFKKEQDSVTRMNKMLQKDTGMKIAIVYADKKTNMSVNDALDRIKCGNAFASSRRDIREILKHTFGLPVSYGHKFFAGTSLTENIEQFGDFSFKKTKFNLDLDKYNSQKSQDKNDNKEVFFQNKNFRVQDLQVSAIELDAHWWFRYWLNFTWLTNRLTLGVKIGKESLSYEIVQENYQDTIKNHTDVDNQKYNELIFGNNYQEKVSMNYFTFTPYVKLYLPGKVFLRYKVHPFIAAGVKFRNETNITTNITGTFTFQGAYDQYGGYKKPLHNLKERYGFVENEKLSAEYSFQEIIRTKFNKWNWFSYSYFYSAGIDFEFGNLKKWRVTVSADYFDYFDFETALQIKPEGIENTNQYFLADAQNALNNNQKLRSIAMLTPIKSINYLVFKLGFSYRIQ